MGLSQKYKQMQSYPADWVKNTFQPGIDYFKFEIAPTSSISIDNAGSDVKISNNAPNIRNLYMSQYRYIIGTVDFSDKTQEEINNDGNLSQYLNSHCIWQKYLGDLEVQRDPFQTTYVYMIGSNISEQEPINFQITVGTGESEAASIDSLSQVVSISGRYGSLFWGEQTENYDKISAQNGDEHLSYDPPSSYVSFHGSMLYDANKLKLFDYITYDGTNKDFNEEEQYLPYYGPENLYQSLFEGSTIRTGPQLFGGTTRVVHMGTDACKNMFKNCKYLTIHNIGASVNIIDKNCTYSMYEGCNRLTTVYIPIYTPYEKPFCGASNGMVDIYYNSSRVKSNNLNENMFVGCHNLQRVYMDIIDSVPCVDYTSTSTRIIRPYGNLAHFADYAHMPHNLFNNVGPIGPTKQINRIIFRQSSVDYNSNLINSMSMDLTSCQWKGQDSASESPTVEKFETTWVRQKEADIDEHGSPIIYKQNILKNFGMDVALNLVADGLNDLDAYGDNENDFCPETYNADLIHPLSMYHSKYATYDYIHIRYPINNWDIYLQVKTTSNTWIDDTWMDPTYTPKCLVHKGHSADLNQYDKDSYKDYWKVGKYEYKKNPSNIYIGRANLGKPILNPEATNTNLYEAYNDPNALQSGKRIEAIELITFYIELEKGLVQEFKTKKGITWRQLINGKDGVRPWRPYIYLDVTGYDYTNEQNNYYSHFDTKSIGLMCASTAGGVEFVQLKLVDDNGNSYGFDKYLPHSPGSCTPYLYRCLRPLSSTELNNWKNIGWAALWPYIQYDYIRGVPDPNSNQLNHNSMAEHPDYEIENGAIYAYNYFYPNPRGNRDKGKG